MAHPFKGFRATKPAARILDKNAGTYHVIFFIYTPAGEKIPYRFSKGLNIGARSEWKLNAEAYADEFWNALYCGWNPLVNKYPEFEKELNEQQELTFPAALDYALKIKTPFLSKWSVSDYKGCVKFMKTAIRTCGIDHIKISAVERKDIKLVINTAKQTREWSSKARNKYLDLLKSLVSVLLDEELIKYNMAHGIKNEPEEKTMGYRRATPEEKTRIERHLSIDYLEFFEYLMFIYLDGIRRKELLMIKIGDINLQRREIVIRPEVAKTNTERTVPINDELGQILMRREIYSLPKDWYLFSKDNFKPGPVMYHPNVPSNWWRDLVIKDLGIDVKMYGLKHTGADDRIEAGTPIQALQSMYGHRSLLMTEIYAQKIKERYKQQLIDQSPTFSEAKVIKMKKAE